MTSKFKALKEDNNIACELIRAICNTSKDYFLVEKIGADFLAGLTDVELAEKYQLSVQEIKYIIKTDLGLSVNDLRKDKEAFSKWLNKYLVEHKCSNLELANMLKVTTYHIWRWLTFNSIPTLKTLNKIERLLHEDLTSVKIELGYMGC